MDEQHKTLFRLQQNLLPNSRMFSKGDKTVFKAVRVHVNQYTELYTINGVARTQGLSKLQKCTSKIYSTMWAITLRGHVTMTHGGHRQSGNTLAIPFYDCKRRRRSFRSLPFHSIIDVHDTSNA